MNKFRGLLAYLAVLPFAAVALGQTQPEGITTPGVGEIKAKPNLMEIDVQATAAGELSADAAIKYRDGKRRIVEAFNKLGMNNLTIEERSLAITSGASRQQAEMMMRGMYQQQSLKPSVEISRTLRVRVSGVAELDEAKLTDAVARLLDVAKDSGALIGPSAAQIQYAYRYGQQQNSSMVRFVLADYANLRDQAYKKAIEDATARADRLARLGGVRRGPMLAIWENATQERTVVTPDPNAQTENESDRVVMSSFGDVTVRVQLQARFAILPAESK